MVESGAGEVGSAAGKAGERGVIQFGLLDGIVKAGGIAFIAKDMYKDLKTFSCDYWRCCRCNWSGD
jgi:hypothetical protein